MFTGWVASGNYVSQFFRRDRYKFIRSGESRFNFSGLEKVHGSINSNTHIVSPLKDDANVSRNPASQLGIDALSDAEKRLAETKLQLALTQSERDELEIELMRLKY